MKRVWWKISAFLSILPTLVLPVPAFAQLNKARGVLKKTDLGPAEGANQVPTIVGGLIDGVIGLLGLVFVILIVYAGYLYLTAGGEEKKVKKAKSMLSQGVIGMIIILSAYFIADLVLNQLTEAGL